jgi:hypothetical protein
LFAGFGAIWSASTQGLLAISETGTSEVVLPSPVKDLGLSAHRVLALLDGAPRLVAVDPTTHHVVRRWTLRSAGEGMAMSGADVYVVEGTGPWTISRIDLRSGTVTSHRLPGTAEPAQDRSVASSPDAVWFATGSTIFQLDPKRLTVVRSVRAPVTVTSIWYGDDALWAASDTPQGGVCRIDPTTMQPGVVQRTDAIQIAFTPDAVWLAAADGATALSPADGRLRGVVPHRTVVDGSGAGIAVESSHLWVSYPDHQVLQELTVRS